MRFREEQPSNEGSESETNALSEAYEALSRRVAKARAEQRLFATGDGYCMAELEFQHLRQVYVNLSVPELVEHALMQGEGGLSNTGALCVKTAPYGTRSPQNTLIVGLGDLPCSGSKQLFDSEQPNALSENAFRHLYQEAQAYVQGRSLYVVDGEMAGGIAVRVVMELASHALFVKQLLYPVAFESGSSAAELSSGLANSHSSSNGPESACAASELSLDSAESEPRCDSFPITLVVLPGLKGEPSLEPELCSEVFTALYPAHRLGLIGGSRHCREIEAALMHLVEPILPEQGGLVLSQAQLVSPSQQQEDLVLVVGGGQQRGSSWGPLHSGSASTLGWWPDAMTALVAGTYVPAEGHLERFGERPTYGFGSLLENVVLDGNTGAPDFGDRRWSPEPRAIPAYSCRTHLAQARSSRYCLGPVRSIVLTLYDPEAIFPPVAYLTVEQLQFYYLCGYSNWKDDGQTASFRACFAPELTLAQALERVMKLGEQIRQLPLLPQMFLVNSAIAQPPTASPLEFLLADGQATDSSMPRLPSLGADLWKSQIQGSAQKREKAKQLFQRFHNYIQQFEMQSASQSSIWLSAIKSLENPEFLQTSQQIAQVLESIQSARPRLP